MDVLTIRRMSFRRMAAPIRFFLATPFGEMIFGKLTFGETTFGEMTMNSQIDIRRIDILGSRDWKLSIPELRD